jgi:hypothetical protein
VEAKLRGILDGLVSRVPDFKYNLRVTFPDLLSTVLKMILSFRRPWEALVV